MPEVKTIQITLQSCEARRAVGIIRPEDCINVAIAELNKGANSPFLIQLAGESKTVSWSDIGVLWKQVVEEKNLLQFSKSAEAIQFDLLPICKRLVDDFVTDKISPINTVKRISELAEEWRRPKFLSEFESILAYSSHLVEKGEDEEPSEKFVLAVKELKEKLLWVRSLPDFGAKQTEASKKLLGQFAITQGDSFT